MPDHVPNIRTVLYVLPGIMEVVKIDWPENSESSVHNHGKSHGWTLVEEGEVYEIVGGETLVHQKGEYFTEAPEKIHLVGSVKGAKTLHFYAPPITGTMTTYKKG